MQYPCAFAALGSPAARQAAIAAHELRNEWLRRAIPQILRLGRTARDRPALWAFGRRTALARA